MKISLLEEIGWDAHFEYQLETLKPHVHYFPARVVAQQADHYRIASEHGDYAAKVTGKFRYSTIQVKDYPVVGDFILAELIPGSDYARIHRVLERKSIFARKMKISGGRKLKNGIIDGGLTEQQVVASNIDTVFILCGLDKDFNISRLERYLTLVQHNRLEAVILLSKADLCSEPEAYMSEVQKVATGIPVFAISTETGLGLPSLSQYMKKGRTVAFLGSSGVGKSTLLNVLFDRQMQTTGAISGHSGKGKHTTTHRELFLHTSGCAIIDTPGMKELQLWADTDDVDYVFDDVLSLIQECRFTNCTHRSEQGCAVLHALENGHLSKDRYRSYQTQSGEISRLHEKQKAYARQMRRQKKNS